MRRLRARLAVGAVAALGAVSVAPAAASAAGLPASGTQKTLMIRVNWTSQDGKMTTERATKLMGLVSARLKESSFGKLSLQTSVTPWLKIPQPAATTGDPYVTCDYQTLAANARAAAKAAGYDPAAYDSMMYYFPRTDGEVPRDIPVKCGALGWWAPGTTDIWINGSGEFARDGNTAAQNAELEASALEGMRHIVVHEYGHAYGLGHPNVRLCTQVVTGTCENRDDDRYDEMGGGNGHYSAPNKAKLGWLDGQLVDATHGAKTTLLPYASSTIGPKAIKIDAGGGNTYWLEYRQRINGDAALPVSATDGVLLRVTGPRSTMDVPSLLDARPSDGLSTTSTGLRAGSSWTTPEGYKISVTSTSTSGASVQVTHAPVIDSQDVILRSSSTPKYAAVVLTYGAPSVTTKVEWGETTAYGASASTTTPADASGSTIVGVGMPNLTPGKTYHYRATITTAAGSVTTQDATFVKTAKPVIDSQDVILRSSSTPKYAAVVLTYGAPSVTTKVEWGETTAYGASASTTTAADASGSTIVGVGMPNLTPGKTYHYRATITTAAGSVTTQDATFVKTAKPVIQYQTILNARTTSPTYAARVQTYGAPSATVKVEYGETTAYGKTTAVSQAFAADSSSEAVVHQDLPNLTIGKTYHYRATITTAAGSITTPDQVLSN